LGFILVEFHAWEESDGSITIRHEIIVDLYNKKMAQYAQDFQSKSQSLISYVQSQLANVVSWSALPGQLNKIVTSSGGYVWGINSAGNIYTCKEPCTGQNWKSVAGPSEIIGVPLDIAVDDRHVYIIYRVPAKPKTPKAGCPAGNPGITSVKTSGGYNVRLYTQSECSAMGGQWIGNGNRSWGMATDGVGECYGVPGGNPGFCNQDEPPSAAAQAAVGQTSSPQGDTASLAFSMQPADGSGAWTPGQAVPGAPPVNPTIHLTDQFMFVGTQGCSKPCTTGSWVAISQPPGGQGIVAASSGNTYALGDKNTIYQSSGNGQGGWKEQSGMDGVMPLAVAADSQFILGVEQSSQRPVRCTAPYTNDDSCSRDSTMTYRPMAGSHTVSVNPRSYQTYVAAASSGTTGNLYQRVDPGTIDHTAAIDQTSRYLNEMDSDVNALGTAAASQNSQIEVAKVRNEANSVIKQIGDIQEERESTAQEQANLKRKIQTMGGPVSEWKTKVLQIIAITLATVLVTYFVFSFVLSPTVNMSIAIVGMLVGVGFAIYFTVTKQ
jgi:hypothetical protein